jgi:DNA-binding transcriptional LysR family regulator
LVLIVHRTHALARQTSVAFADTLELDHVGLHSNSSIYVAMRQAAVDLGKSIRLRIQVSGLDAMCRMIHNGLGVGVMPLRAFTLMHNAGDLCAVALTDPWAQRNIALVARDFSTLPRSARLLVDHLKSTL